MIVIASTVTSFRDRTKHGFESSDRSDAAQNREILLKHMDEIINRAKSKSAENVDKSSAFFQLLQIKEDDITESELKYGLLLLLFASYDTTAASICNLVYNMHRHPRETQILSEAVNALDRDENGRFRFDELMDCAYLDGFAKESMRMVPAVCSRCSDCISHRSRFILFWLSRFYRFQRGCSLTATLMDITSRKGIL